MPDLETLNKIKNRLNKNGMYGVHDNDQDNIIFESGEKSGLCQKILPGEESETTNFKTSTYVTKGINYTTLFLKITDEPIEIVKLKALEGVSNEEEFELTLYNFSLFIMKWGYSTKYTSKNKPALKKLWKSMGNFHHPFSIPTDLVNEFENELESIFKDFKKIKPEIIKLNIKITTAVCPVCDHKSTTTDKKLVECSNCGNDYSI